MFPPHIPFYTPGPAHIELRAEMLATLARVYDSSWYVRGAEGAAFEQAYAAFSQTAHCVGVGNGLDALTLALLALGVGPGDEVLVPANTYIATWLAVSQVGATPVPVEPDPATSNLNPARLEAARTARTRAVIAVHLYGQACAMTAIRAFADQHGLWVVEDNAQAQGAAWRGQPTGSLGHAAATSFYPTKNLGALGDGGAVTTADAALAGRVRRLANYGSVIKYQHEELGYNSRLDELQAAALRVKLPHLARWTAERQALAAAYDAALADVPGLRLPTTALSATHVYHLYVVHTPRRDALRQHLAARGIETGLHYPVPPHRQPAYVHLGLAPGSLPITEALAATCLSLPLWPGLGVAAVGEVSAAVREFLE